MTRPETYYDAKRALYAKAETLKASYGYADFVKNIDHVLNALGYEVPAPVLDERGKPLRAWKCSVRSALPKDLADEFRDQSQRLAQERRLRWDHDVSGVIVAASKAAALDAIFGPDRKNWSRPKTTEIGEVSPASLDYEAATSHPGMLVAISPDGEYVPITVAEETP